MEHCTDVDCVWNQAKKLTLEEPIKQRVCADGACVNLDEPVKALLSHLYSALACLRIIVCFLLFCSQLHIMISCVA
jgi:hypothetical protein